MLSAPLFRMAHDPSALLPWLWGAVCCCPQTARGDLCWERGEVVQWCHWGCCRLGGQGMPVSRHKLAGHPEAWLDY